MKVDLEDIEGVGPTTAKKLREAGLTTIEAIAVTPIRELMVKTGLSDKTAFNVSQKARKIVSIDFVTAKEVWERRRDMLRCSTGSKKLDDILEGGIETQAMTELIGEYAAGKTQICLMLCVMVQLTRDQGGLEGNALFIDTEGTFSPERVYQIASAKGLDPQKALENIIISRAYTSDHQRLLIDHLFKICAEESVKLVIVDSMIGHFRGEYIGRENLAERQQKLNHCLHKLLRLAEIYNLAVVVTNQVQANPAQFFGDPNRPAGGHVMAHECTHRIYIRKGKGGSRLAKIIDSPYLPESSEYFLITEKGIEDILESI
jgi:DNA repair protein RadA